METADQKTDAYARLIAQRLRQIIVDHGQVPVADAIGCDQKTISRFVSGEGAINAESVAKLIDLGGYKLVRADEVTVDPDRYRGYLLAARETLDNELASLDEGRG